MLNYVWIGLLIIGITAAVITDIGNESKNKFRNNEPFGIIISFQKPFDNSPGKHEVEVIVSAEKFNQFYSDQINSNFIIPGNIQINEDKVSAYLTLKTDTKSPSVWKLMAEASGEKDDLSGNVTIKEKISDKSVRA
ncbi:MAG TPA: hypothetical protein VH917_05670, partial [Ignavibacteriaceae bacterium]